MMTRMIQGASPKFFPPAWADMWGEDDYGLYADLVLRTESFNKAEAQRFRWIAAGDFLMGSPKNEPERLMSEQQHKVSITQGYWLGDTVVTQTLWSLVMGENPASFKGQINPVENVSWNDSQKFIRFINEEFSELFEGFVLRLPTEAEWEHACRAGTISPFSFGENITSAQVNFGSFNPYHNGEKSNARNKSIAVKSLPPNLWGLYEMHGNVTEWCADAWQSQLGEEPTTDPYHVGNRFTNRVHRGGSWASSGRYVRSADRFPDSHDSRKRFFGLRLSLGPDLKTLNSKKKSHAITVDRGK